MKRFSASCTIGLGFLLVACATTTTTGTPATLAQQVASAIATANAAIASPATQGTLAAVCQAANALGNVTVNVIKSGAGTADDLANTQKAIADANITCANPPQNLAQALVDVAQTVSQATGFLNDPKVQAIISAASTSASAGAPSSASRKEVAVSAAVAKPAS